MSAIADAIITYAILRKFTTPIKETQAYKLGLVDENGVATEKSKHDATEQGRDAYTLLDRLVFKLKRMFKTMPLALKLIGGYAAALALIKESTDDESHEDFSIFDHLDPHAADYWHSVVMGESVLGMDKVFISIIAEDAHSVAMLVDGYKTGNQDAVMEELIGNTTAQVQGLGTEPVVTKEAQKRWVKKNEDDIAGIARRS